MYVRGYHGKFCEALLWRHNGGECVSTHQPWIYLLNRLFGVDQRKHQSSASLAFVWEILRGPVNSSHKGPVTWKMFPFDDDIMGKPLRGLGWGLLNQLPPFCYFPDLFYHQQTFGYWSNITLIFDRCRCSSAAVASVKYEGDSRNLTATF